jgi:hypothetical protein
MCVSRLEWEHADLTVQDGVEVLAACFRLLAPCAGAGVASFACATAPATAAAAAAACMMLCQMVDMHSKPPLLLLLLLLIA